MHKKGDRTDKTEYPPVSILPAISKVFEKLLSHQINDLMNPKLSQNQCGFRKGFSAQYCLILMLENWRKSLDTKGFCGVLLTDLSKAFDCLDHGLLIARMKAYGFDNNALLLIHSYLINRYQRVSINSNYSSWSEILKGVPQEYILGPLLFNIYLSDLFLFSEGSNIANYADDNSPYAVGRDIESVILQLEEDSKTLINWVCNNGLKANPDKFHLITTCSNPNISVNVDGYEIQNSSQENLLGITIDNKLRNVRSVSYGIDTLSFLGPKIWSIVPIEIKEATSLREFKNKIKGWRPVECPCKLCKTYIAGVGFIDVK